jgi:hypothetical protein
LAEIPRIGGWRGKSKLAVAAVAIIAGNIVVIDVVDLCIVESRGNTPPPDGTRNVVLTGV